MVSNERDRSLEARVPKHTPLDSRPTLIPVELSALLINERAEEQVVCLAEVGGARKVPIVIGLFEAFALDRILKDCRCERPLTHDLMISLVDQLDAVVSRIEIDDLQGDVYFAKVVLGRGETELRVDARPSDALALALKCGAPVFVEEHVLDAVPG
jgi:uncharacterized protein